MDLRRAQSFDAPIFLHGRAVSLAARCIFELRKSDGGAARKKLFLEKVLTKYKNIRYYSI